MADIILPPKGQFLREDVIRGGMDLLFFVNTRHLKPADEHLAGLGLGRAHHRLLYFVARRPGISVSEILGILNVTKQSLNRVTKDLIERKLMDTRAGDRDRRQRLMQLTPAGISLERELFGVLQDNVVQAYAASGAEAVNGFWVVCQHLIGDEGRTQFRKVQSAE